VIDMKKTLAALALAAGATSGFAQATPVGLWKTLDDATQQERSLVRVSDTGGVLTGRIEKVLDPARQEARCEKCTDARKDKPLLGLTIVEGVRKDPSEPVWEGGTILDPNNGKTYKVRLTPQDGGKTLNVRGYIGAPLLGRTQTWIRVE
jgi:uncharacterized protein (DUF2147 family)